MYIFVHNYYAYIHITHTHIYKHTHTHARTYTHTRIQTYMHICMHVNACCIYHPYVENSPLVRTPISSHYCSCILTERSDRLWRHVAVVITRRGHDPWEIFTSPISVRGHC